MPVMNDLATRIVAAIASEMSLALFMGERDRARLADVVRDVLADDDARIQALERVAKAARDDVVIRYGLTHTTPGEYAAKNSDWISANGQAVLEALGALEALENTSARPRAEI